MWFFYVRFDENYGLASTQSLKNKDIPEGGAKGTILPSYVPRDRHIHSRLTINLGLVQAPVCASRSMLM